MMEKKEKEFHCSPENVRWQFYLLGFFDERVGITRDADALLKKVNEKYMQLHPSDFEYEMIRVHYYHGHYRYQELSDAYYTGFSKNKPDDITYSFIYCQDGLLDEIKELIEAYPDFNYEMKKQNRPIK